MPGLKLLAYTPACRPAHVKGCTAFWCMLQVIASENAQCNYAPACRPAYVKGSTVSPCSASSHRMGRE